MERRTGTVSVDARKPRETFGSPGVEIGYELLGATSSPPMVLLHALGQSSENWRPIALEFASEFRVLMIDFRGHGASQWPGNYTFEIMRDDVLAVLDAFSLSDVVLVGHSMGGVVAYLLAQAQPHRVRRLIIEDVPPPYLRSRPIPARPDGDLLFDWRAVEAILDEVNDPTRRWWPGLAAITAPTLLIGGGPTSSIPQHLLEEVADLVPRCTLVTIDAGHYIHASEPHAFTIAVQAWLRAEDEAGPALV